MRKPNTIFTANFSAFEIDDQVLSNMREYALANSLYWALAEGHACEQSARRNAMDVSPIISSYHKVIITKISIECFQERRRHDRQVPDSLQPNTSSRHYWRIGRDYYWCCCFRRVEEINLWICTLVSFGSFVGQVELIPLCTYERQYFLASC